MTPAQKKLKELRERQSRERQRMAELGLADSLTDETRSELDTIETGTPDLERQLRAATMAVEQEEGEQRQAAAEAEPDAEMRERRDLGRKASLAGYFRAALRGVLPSGAEAEFAAAAGVEPGSVPMELWDAARPAEQRADAPTSAPATGTGVNLQPIQPYVFAESVTSKLMIEMPRAQSGAYSVAVISTPVMGAAKAKGDPIDATAVAFTPQTTTSHRISARVLTRIEDVATIGTGNYESTLRQNTAEGLSAALDLQALNGDGSGDNLNGILSRQTPVSDPSNVADFDIFLAAFAEGIDGNWANKLNQVGILAGTAAYKLSSRAFRDAGDGNKRGDVSFATYAENNLGDWWTSSRMPDMSNSNIEVGLLHRMGHTGQRRAVMPHWGEIGITDIYSGAASGEVAFTLHALVGDVIVIQPAAFAEVRFKVA